jgi:hypothetical protein
MRFKIWNFGDQSDSCLNVGHYQLCQLQLEDFIGAPHFCILSSVVIKNVDSYA